ncbi:MAG TPA: hypothetical protein DEP84_22090 [Chloroflexi bacterium]|nr:hypothetical protein [Chloroflexota bacterium]
MLGLLRKAWRDLVGRRVRSTLTVLGVMAGVAGLVAIVSTARGFVRAQAVAFDQSSQADITMWVWDAPAGLARMLAGRPDISTTDLRMDHYLTGRLGGRPTNFHFVGLDNFKTQPVNRIVLVAGQWPRSDEALIEPDGAAQAGMRIGDTVSYRDQNGRERPLTISGLARAPTTLSAQITGLPTLYVHASLIRAILNISGSNQLNIRTAPNADPQTVAREVTMLLDRRGIQHAAPRLRAPDTYPGKRELDALFALLYLFAALGLLLSGFLVANTLSALVAESTREIGIMKAVGATSWQILFTYLVAALLYGGAGTAVGLVAGTALGFVLLRVLGGVANLEPGLMIEPAALALGTVVGLGLSLLGGLIPAWQAAGIAVQRTLTTYGISQSYGLQAIDRLARGLTAILRNVPLAAMAIRNLARRKARAGVTIAVVALAVAALLAASATDASVARTIDDVFEIYTADAWAIFSRGSDQGLAESLRAVPGVTAAEGWLLRDCWAGRDRARCWGLPADTRLYHPVLRAGRWLDSRVPNEVVISEDLAHARHLRPGDDVLLQVGREQRLVRVRGVVHDNSIFLGSTVTAKVFVPLPTMAPLVNDRRRADLYALSLAPRDLAGMKQVLGTLERRFAPLKPNSEPALAEFEAAQAQTRILTAALRGMVLLVGLIGAIGLLNTLALNVLERRREIGVLRALGSDSLQIIETFLAEGLTVGFLGWLLGVILGWLLGRLFIAAMSTVLFGLPYVFPAIFLPGSLAFALVLSLIASIGPAFAAASVPAAEALRYE